MHEELTPSLRAKRLRGIASFSAAAASFVAALAFLPPFWMSLFDAEGGVHMQMALGLSGWQILFLELALFGLAIGFTTLGIHDFKAVESGEEPAAPDTAPSAVRPE